MDIARIAHKIAGRQGPSGRKQQKLSLWFANQHTRDLTAKCSCTLAKAVSFATASIMKVLALFLLLVIACCVKGCKSRQYKRSTGRQVPFHRFPIIKSRRKRWIEHANRGADWQPSANDRMCSVHFSEASFVNRCNGKRRKLLASAEPSQVLCF